MNHLASWAAVVVGREPLLRGAEAAGAALLPALPESAWTDPPAHPLRADRAGRAGVRRVACPAGVVPTHPARGRRPRARGRPRRRRDDAPEPRRAPRRARRDLGRPRRRGDRGRRASAPRALLAA